jgi:methyl-accepting chemotaxis protein
MSTSLAGWFADRRIATKIITSVAVALLTAGTVGWMGLAALAHANREARETYRHDFAALTALAEARESMLKAAGEIPMVLVANSAEDETKHQDRHREAVAESGAAFAHFLHLGVPAELDDEVRAYESAMTEYVKLRDEQLLPLATAHRADEFEELIDDRGDGLFAGAEKALEDLMAAQSQRVLARTDQLGVSYESNRNLIVVLIVAGVALSLGIGAWTVTLIVRPLREVSDVLAAVARGDLTREVAVRSRDELGTMAGTLNQATEGMRTAVTSLDSTASALATAAEQLASTNTQIAASAEEASTQATVVASAAEEVTRNVQDVAAGTEQTGVAIREIAQNAHEAARVAANAVGVAESTNRTVSKLGDSSVEIGNVVKVITSIAEQTNLLALNATIEAARAGEAGKGFAVVASEVKDLAQETAKATEDIARRVAAIQSDTESAVVAISEIGGIIARINDYQTTIAAAVEEQTATTSEMNRGVAEAAGGSADIAANIIAVATATKLTTENVTESQRASKELARMSGDVYTIVSRFRV